MNRRADKLNSLADKLVSFLSQLNMLLKTRHFAMLNEALHIESVFYATTQFKC